jgi:hypothetical protein
MIGVTGWILVNRDQNVAHDVGHDRDDDVGLEGTDCADSPGGRAAGAIPMTALAEFPH